MLFGRIGRLCGGCARAATMPLTESPCERRPTEGDDEDFELAVQPALPSQEEGGYRLDLVREKGNEFSPSCSFPEPLHRAIRWLDTRGLRSSEGCWKGLT